MERYDAVTIGVITYNSESTVIETLESLINQTYPNIYIIVSDDCSSDSTVSVIENWILSNDIKNVNLKVNPSNLGVSENLNSILEMVESKWVKFIAGDDLLLPGSINSYIEYVNSQDAKVISSKCISFGNMEYILPKPSKACFFEQSSEAQFRYLGIGNFVISPTLFFDTDFLKKIGGYNSEFRTVDDLPMLIRCTLEGEKIHFVNEVLVKYRIHDESISLSKEKNISFKSDLKKIYSTYYSDLGLLYRIHFEILSKSHGIRNRYIKYFVKYLSPLMWYMKFVEMKK
ncbi:glycosyltransferase family 2 protein [Vibrio splendidus]|uniref:glycosyltransferase family 2 protein n=1 Tax=Vibrio splendidus TaxID=29497 RepID=UPI003D11972C